MRICRYQERAGGPVRTGVAVGDQLFDVSAIAGELPVVRWPLEPGDLFIRNLERLRPRIEALVRAASPIPVASVKLKSPIANPGKFVCGVAQFPSPGKPPSPPQYHPLNLGLLFKMTSAMAGAGDGVTLRWPERETAHEMEIAIVIGREGTEILAADALSYVAGYAIGLDMTMQGAEFPSFSKSFDSYGVLGPWMVTADEIPDPAKLNFWLKVNGEMRQQDCVGNLILGVPQLIEHVTSIMTVHPGDVIFSGTPSYSLGMVRPGDVMEAHIDVIGDMTVAVSGGPGRKTVPPAVPAQP